MVDRRDAVDDGLTRLGVLGPQVHFPAGGFLMAMDAKADKRTPARFHLTTAELDLPDLPVDSFEFSRTGAVAEFHGMVPFRVVWIRRRRRVGRCEQPERWPQVQKLSVPGRERLPPGFPWLLSL